MPEPRATPRPSLSVIMPVRDGAHFLPTSIAALQANDLPGDLWELVVVDDGSRDQSGDIAARHGATVLRGDGIARGPAYARNRGAEASGGRYLLFVDADVAVHADVFRRVVETFEREPETSAVFGAYDLAPAAPGLVSQYRNLLHRYVHERDAGEAVTFWAGCGAVRAKVFASVGGFDEDSDGVEDIELGYRLAGAGYRIMLRPDIQGRHLKRWTLRTMIATDVWNRGVPWIRLLRRHQVRPRATLNLRASEKVCTALAAGATLALAALAVTGDGRWLIAAAAGAGGVLALNAPLLAWFVRHRGPGFAVRVIPLRLLYYELNVVSLVLALLPSRRST